MTPAALLVLLEQHNGLTIIFQHDIEMDLGEFQQMPANTTTFQGTDAEGRVWTFDASAVVAASPYVAKSE
jgi:hypothetical protein